MAQTRYNLVDRLEDPNPGAGRLPDFDTRHRTDPNRRGLTLAGLITLGVALACAFGLVAAFVGPLVHRWQRWVDTNDLLDRLFGLVVVALAALLIGACVALLAWLRVWVLRSAVLRLQNDHPVSVASIPQIGQLAGWSLDAHYRVQQTWAQQSGMRGLGAYSPSFHNRQDLAPGHEPPMLASPTIPALDTTRGLFEQLPIQTGSLFVGYGPDGQPLHTRTGAAGLLAIAGRSGSGKTATARLLIAQHCLHGGGVALIDGHGHAGAESLAQSCAPLRGAFLADPAIDDRAIWQTIQQIDDLARRRLGGDADRTPVLLVIDEFTSLALRHPQAEDLIKRLIAFGNEYRKVGVTALLIGHSWKAGMISDRYGTALRSAIGTRLVHRTDPDNARYLLRSDELVGVDRLPTGGALVFDGDSEPKRASVPLVRHTDLLAIAPRLAARSLPDLRSALEEKAESRPGRPDQNTEHDRDLLARLLFAHGATVRAVAAVVRGEGYQIDNNALTEIRAAALGGEPVATRPDGLEAVQNTQQITRPCPKCGALLDMAKFASARRRGHCAQCKG
jgi:hypothetical protein